MSILQPAVKKETQKVVIYTVVGVILMWIVLFLLRPAMPDKIVFDYTTILAGIIGGGVAVLNFFLMGISVQNIAATEDQDLAKKKMKTSYSQRMALQLIWVVIAIAAPCFYFVAGFYRCYSRVSGSNLWQLLKNNYI